jgi:hypothetical protein
MQKEELYISYITKEVAVSGTTTSDNDFKLIDAGALFLTGATPISKGDLATNTATQQTARVIKANSDTEITLDKDIFPVGSSPAAYKINKQINERVELLESLKPNLTFNIADIAKPDQRKSDYSKTVRLPASKRLRKVFENIFEINVDLNTFNPNLKTDVLYLVDGEINLDGYLQLKKINILDNDDIVFECTLFGRIGNFIVDLENKELTDLDFSALNHIYNKTNQTNSWVYPLPVGQDYVYPMVNYDINYAGQPFSESWDVEDFFPAITVRKYIVNIFEDAGYTFTSNFFDSTYFKNLIIPFSSKNFALTETAINNRTFEANTPQIQATSLDYVYALEKNDDFSFDDEAIKNTNEVSDISNVHNTTTGIYTPNEDGYYNLEAMLQLQGEFTAPTGGVTDYELISYIHGFIEINRYDNTGTFINTLDQISFAVSDIGALVPPSTTVTTAAAPTTPSDDYIYVDLAGSSLVLIIQTGQNNNSICNKYFVNANNVYLNANDQVKIEVKYAVRPINIIPGGASTGLTFLTYGWRIGSTYYNGPVNGYKLNILDGYFRNSVVNSGYVEGNTIDMNSAVPLKIKQKDFFMSIVKMFNLYIQTNTSDEKNLLIEPRDDFYDNVTQDWSQKYESTWNKVYGEYDKEIENDFINKQYKNELIFSPTPSVGQEWYDRVLPTIIKFDDKNGVQRTEANIRILQWAGLKNTQQQWVYEDNSGTLDLRSSYPYAGMYNDPYIPTEDIGFGLTDEIYWSAVFGNTITWSNNNLYNKYYKKFIEEITDVNSKIVKGWFYLRPSDITNLSFRNQYYFDGAYFRLNKVENYNPTNPITKCEFLKLKDVDAFVSSTATANGGVLQKLGDETVPKFSNGNAQLIKNNSIGNRNHNVDGNNNYISRSSTNVEIQGDNNRVYSNAYNINIQGDNNTINPGVENVTLINTNNVNVRSSNVTYINGEIRGAGSVERITTSITADQGVATYLVDTSSGNINVNLPTDATIGKIWNVKLLDNTNSLQLRCVGRTIDGNVTITITQVNTCISVQFDGNDYKII